MSFINDETWIGSLNSNVMIPDFPHNIHKDWPYYFFLLSPDVALSLSCWLSQFSFSKLRQQTGQSNVRTFTKTILIRSILVLYYEESLVCIIKFEFKLTTLIPIGQYCPTTNTIQANPYKSQGSGYPVDPFV